MTRATAVLLALLIAPPAWAVPAAFSTQGRMLGADGAPVEGTLDLTFRLIDSDTGGATVWSEAQSVSFTNGYYSVVLGAEEAGNPLSDAVLDQWPLWLEVQVDGQPPMFPRTSLGSVPYARVAGRAEELIGGLVDADSLAVGGAPVVDASGAWVGAPIAADWAGLVGVPAGFADGVDADLLGSLSCAGGQTLVFSAASGWTCADPSALLGAVDADITVLRTDLDALTLTCDSNTAAIGTLGGRVAVLESGSLVLNSSLSGLDGRVSALEALSDVDTLSALSCLDGDVTKWDAALSAWICADDLDTRLNEAEVDAMVADNGFATDADLVGLGAELAVLEGNVAGLDADLAAVDGDVSAVDARVTGIGGRVTALEGTVASQGGLLTTLGSAVAGLGTRLSAAEALVGTLASTAFSGSFLDLSDVPAELEDGDDDTLGGMECADGEVARWSASAGEWACFDLAAAVDASPTVVDVVRSGGSISGIVLSDGSLVVDHVVQFFPTPPRKVVLFNNYIVSLMNDDRIEVRSIYNTSAAGAAALEASLSGTYADVVGGGSLCVRTFSGGVLCSNTLTPATFTSYISSGASALAVAGTGSQACAITSSGSIQCWRTDTSSSVLPSMAGPFVRLSVMQNQVCGVKSSGSIQCSSHITIAHPPPSTGSYTHIAFGGVTSAENACALTTSGDPVCWGSSAESPPNTALNDIFAVGNGWCGTRRDTDKLICWAETYVEREVLLHQ